jgi:hypothetical protein
VSVQDFIHKILLSHPDFVGQLRAWGSDVIENKIGHYLTPEELKTLLDNRQILLDIADGVFHAGLIRGDTQSNQARDSVSGFSGIFLPIIDLTRNNVGPLNKSKDQPELPKRPNTGDAFSSLFVEEEFAGDIHLDSATFDFANQKKVLSVDDIIQNKVLFVFDESLIYEMNQILRQNSEKSAEIRKWIQDHLSPNQHFYEILAAQISQLLNNPNLDTVETQGQHIAIDWMARYAQQNDSIQNSAQMWMDNHKQLQNQMKAWLFEALQQYQLKKSRERFTYPGSDNLKRKVEITISNSYVIISEFNSNGDKRPFFSFDYNVTSGNRVRLIPAADLITKYNDRYFHESLFTGKDLMDFMFYFIEQFNGYEIESISAQWKYNDDPILSQNYYQFVKNLSLTPPQTLEQAASNTWTGQIYGSHGFYVSTGSFSVGNGIIGRPWAWVKCEFINGKSRPQKITDSNNFFNNNFFRHFFSGIFMPIVTLAPNLGNITLEDSIAYLNSPTIGEISEPSIDKLSFNQISQFESVKNRDPQKVVKKWTDPSGMTFYFIYEPPNPIRNFLANIISLNFNSTEAEKEQGMHVIGQKLGINYLKTKLLDFNGVRVFVAEEVKNDLKINYKDFKGQIHHNVNMETAYTLMTRDLSFSSKFSNAEKYKILERGGFRFNIKDKNILLDLLTGTSDRGLRHNIFVLNYRSISKIFNLDSLPIDIQSEDNIFQFYDAGQAFVWDLETRLSAPYNFQKDLQEYFFDDINISNPVLYLKSMLAKPENQDFVRSLQNWSENEIHEDLSFLDIDQRNVFLRNRTVMLKYANEIMKQ